MISHLFLLSLSLSASLPSITAVDPCLVQANVTNSDNIQQIATYDLTQLRKDPDYYKVFGEPETSNTNSSKYTYAFNVCQQVVFEDDPSLRVRWSEVCGNATDSKDPSSAYQLWFETPPKKDGQVQPDEPKCKSLGLWDATQQTVGYPLNNDLSKGVSIMYDHGTRCHNRADPNLPGPERKFWITIYCDAEGSSNPQKQVHEDSQDKCQYEIIFRSPAGCPRSCPLVSPEKDKPSQVCAGRGICGQDRVKGPRCFCNQGWNGQDCMTPDSELESSSCSGVCVGLIFVLILLIVLLIGGSIIYYRVHKLSTMNITFSALTESFATNAGVENRHDDEDETSGDLHLHTHQNKNPIRGNRSGSHAAPSSADFVVDDLND